MIEVRLPQLSEEVDESLVVLWNVSKGDAVKKGDVLVEVQTEKAVSEIEAKQNGTVTEILVDRGESAKVGDVLARINPAEVQNETNPAKNQPGEAEIKKKAEPNSRQSETFVRVPPRLRRLAKELNVDLKSVQGSGKNHSITENDIRKADTNENQTHHSVPLSGTRGTIARRMMDSLQSSAQLTETSWAEVTSLTEERLKMDRQVSWTAIIAKAVATALTSHPSVNAHIKDGKIVKRQEIHLGIAIDTPNGLLVPVLRHADQYAAVELDEEIRRLAEAARNGDLTAEEQSDSTFTISSLGAYPVQFFTPILNPPEAGILGIGKIETYLALERAQPVERKRLPLSFTFDHRALDGAPAARFLFTLNALLEEPEKLLPKPFQV